MTYNSGRGDKKQMSVKDTMKPLEDYLGYLFLFVGMILEIVLGLGLGIVNLVVFSIPLISFVLWVLLYIYGYRAKVKFQDDIEHVFIETARAYVYFFSLSIALILNTFLIFNNTPNVRIIVIVSVGVILSLLEILIPRTFFRTQTSFFDKNQTELFYKLLSRVGSVSIYYSMTVAIFDSLFVEIVQKPYVFNPLFLFAAIAGFAIPVFLIYWRESSSRRYSERLATSLKETNWSKKYEREKRLEKRRIQKKKHEPKSTKRRRKKLKLN